MLLFQAFTDCYRIHQLKPLACNVQVTRYIDNLDQYRSLCCVKRERMYAWSIDHGMPAYVCVFLYVVVVCLHMRPGLPE